MQTRLLARLPERAHTVTFRGVARDGFMTQVTYRLLVAR